MRHLREDSSAITMNVGIGWILGSILVMFCSILYVFHSKNWLPELTGMFWTYAPLIFAFGIALISTQFMKNWKMTIIIFIVAAVGYFLVQVL